MRNGAPEGVDPGYIPVPFNNAWRPIDDSIAGLDGWAQLEYSWVIIDETSDVSPGGSVTGAFSMLMDPFDSNSRFVIQGRFEVPNIRRERWAGPDLRQEQLEANGTELCRRRLNPPTE